MVLRRRSFGSLKLRSLGSKMQLYKIVGAAAVLAAPLSIATAQSGVTPDSGTSNHAGKWITATGTAVGAALFLSFTRAGGSSPNSPAVHASDPDPSTPTPPQAATPAAPAPPSATAPSDPQPAANPPSAADSPATAPPADSTPAATATAAPTTSQDSPGLVDNATTQPQTTEAPNPPTDSTIFTPPRDDYPHAAAQTDFETPSTVPEPSSMALTATGIIGLIPLIRRRRR